MSVASLTEVTSTTLELLRWPNDVEPNANRGLGEYLATWGNEIEVATLLLVDHKGIQGLVGPVEIAAGRHLLGLRNHASFDTLYAFLPVASQAARMEAELRELFYKQGLHGFIGRALRFSEVADLMATQWGVRPRSGEAVFARWGYATARTAESFSE